MAGNVMFALMECVLSHAKNMRLRDAIRLAAATRDARDAVKRNLPMIARRELKKKYKHVLDVAERNGLMKAL